MESTLLGVVLDSSLVIEAERKRQTVQQLLKQIMGRIGGEQAAKGTKIPFDDLVIGGGATETRCLPRGRKLPASHRAS